jgi:hypothetical protein
MIRDLIESSLSRLKLQFEDRDQAVDVVTYVVGAAADHAVRELMQGRALLRPKLKSQIDDERVAEPADRDPTSEFRGTKRGKVPRDPASEKEMPTKIAPA